MIPWNRLGWVRRRSALVVLAIGLITSAVIVPTVSLQQRTEVADELAHEAEVISAVLSEAMDLTVSQLRSLQGLFDASADVTSAEFARFTLRQGASPGMIAVGYAQLVTENSFQEWLADAQADRSYFQVLDRQRRPIEDFPADRSYLVPVWYSLQHETRPSLLGVDIGEDPIRREAIERAILLREPVISDPVAVLGDTDGQNVEIYALVTSSDGAVQGVVFATVEIDEVAGSIVSEISGSDLELAIADVTGEEVPAPVREPGRWAGTTEVGDRLWRVEVIDDDPASGGSSAVWRFGLGATISILAAAATGLGGTSRQHAREVELLRRSTREKDVFLATVAHELRTPLTSVVGMTAVLNEEWARMSPTEVTELLHIAHSEAADLSDLIEDLLIAGRLRAGAIYYRQEKVDLSSELNRVVGRLNTGLELTVELPDAGPVVLADSLRVRQVARNLLGNSTRYGESRIVIEIAESKSSVDFIVRNDGPPIPEEIVPNLFEPYSASTARTGQPGSIGLGLHISRTLARAMGGDLRYAYIDGWCQFTLRLPLYPQESGTVARSQLLEVGLSPTEG